MITSRRDILKWLCLTPLLRAESLSGTSVQSRLRERPELCLVSRHVQWTDMEEGAAVAAEAGFKAIAWTVRPGAHIEPDRVERELPRAVEIAHKAGLGTPMIITAVVDAESPRVEAILDTLRGLGIRRYRAASFRYDYAGDLNAQFEALKPRVAGLVKLSEKYGTTAMYHTHSSPGAVGGGVWDLWLLVKEYDPKLVGINYDVGHATVRGGTEWIETSRFAHRHIHALSLKDFKWVKLADTGSAWPWMPEFVPPGEGMVNFRDIFSYFKSVGFSGPLETYYEYTVHVPGRPVPVNMLGTNYGTWKLEMPKSQFLALLKRDVNFYSRLLQETQLVD